MSGGSRFQASSLSLSLLLWLLLLCRELDLCDSLNAEGRALLGFRERVERDPYGALDDWDEGNGIDPCSWSGVECSHDGRVISLNLKDLCLEGTLASELGKLTHMKSLILRNNSFSGIIPREIGDLQKLEVLDLGHNNLTGPLPSGLGSILSLEILILRNNRFIGSLSEELHELNTLSELQINEEVLSSDTGSIKRSVGNGTIRRLLQLGNRDKGGHNRNVKNHTDSPAIRAPTHNRNVKNHTDSPAIRAPTQAPSPSHVVLKHPLSPLTSPFLSPFPPPEISPSPTSTSPNSLPPSTSVPSPSPAPSPSPIGEPPSLFPSPITAPPPTSLPFEPILEGPSPSVVKIIEVKHGNHHWKIYGPISGVVFLLASMVICILCFRANKVVTVRPWATGLSGQLQKAFVTGVPSLKRSELEISCEDFSNIIGSLPDCKLYKGTLSSGVEIVVVSSLITSAKDWSKQSETLFKKKISMLSKVNHKNFINLLGYCVEGEPFTRMMVFEYAPNGTLFEHLHIKEAEPLDWTARLRIAMGVAYCLEYMQQLNPPVILRNLDSSSIYLTDDYAAKISDLGFWNTGKESEPVSESSGPLDTPKSDSESIVYRFGLILLELLSGRVPFSVEEGLLEQWASSYLTGKSPLKEMVDPTLKSLRDEETSALCDVIQSCINPNPEERPAMAEIARRLRDITAMAPEGATPKLSPLWWAELEILSSEAN